MRTGPGYATGRAAALWREESGNATIEFIVIFPLLMYFIFSMGEIGVLMTRSMMLSRGIDIAIRDVRLGLTAGITHDDLKVQICDAAFLLGECEDVILLELSPMPNAGSFPTAAVSCVDRTSDVEPVINFNPGARSEIMLVRACLIVDPVFPGTGIGALLPKDASGGYSIVVQSAFMNEPA